MLREREFWAQFNNSETRDIYNKFTEICRDFENSIKPNSYNNGQFHIDQAISRLNNTGWPLVFSQTAVSQYLLKKDEEGDSAVKASIDFLLKGKTSALDINNAHYFKNYIDAYFFQNGDSSLLKANEAHETTLYNLRNGYRDKFEADSNQFTKDKEFWDSEFKVTITRIMDRHAQFTKESEEQRDEIVNELENIKTSYTEKLRLEGPAKY